MNTFIHKNGKVADRQLDPYMQQTKQKKTRTCSTVGLKE